MGLLDLVVGPKIGYWASYFYDGDSGGKPSWSYSGWILGLQIGAFYKVGRVGIGGIVSYDDGHPTKVCMGYEGTPSQCESNHTLHDDRLLSLVAGVTF